MKSQHLDLWQPGEEKCLKPSSYVCVSKENGNVYMLAYIYVHIYIYKHTYTQTFTYMVGNFKVTESFDMDYLKYVLGKCS